MKRNALVLGGSLFACAACVVPSADSIEDSVTTTPETSVRNQKDTGNCWLYATTAWVESLEYADRIDRGTASADDPSTRPEHFSVAYLDYWDWYTKITTGQVKYKRAQTIKDTLDSGGSWGAAVEIIASYGLMRTTDFSDKKDADLATSALDSITKSLISGALRDPNARRNGAIVRRELDKAFGLKASVSSALASAFDDGSTKFPSAAASSTVIDPNAFEVLLPIRDARSERHALIDAIGDRAGGDDPDKRTGAYAWSVVAFDAQAQSDTREYFRRVQRALNAGVPLPISWYFASNGDPTNQGKYTDIPAKPAVVADSGGHETLIDDYEVKDVPGYGTLAAGTPASQDAMNASLDDGARVVFLRVKNSWGASEGTGGHDDLYFDYLTGTLRVCPKGDPKSAKCTTEIPLEDVTLPAGF